MKLAIAYLSLLVFPLMCGGNPDNTVYETAVTEEAAAPAMIDDKAASGNFEAQTEQKIIKESNLRYETQDLDATYQQIIASVKKNKAYVQSDAEGKDYNSLYRTITVRIPNANFDAFLADVGKGVAYFDRKEISSKDVTAEFIDLSARIKAKKILEERYLELLKKAVKVSEILEIEKELSAIREEIEAKEGQLKYLESRVSESTVTISFYKTIAQKQGVKISYGSKIWTAIQSGFFSLSDFLISIISIWPFIIVFCVLVYFIRKRFKRKKI